MKNIYCIVAPSGTGKTTVVEELTKWGYKEVQSYTDRPPRTPNERGHIFLSREEFDQLQDLCAYTMFNGHQYGVTADLIERNDLYVIDPPGVVYMRQEYHGKKRIRIIGLTADESVVIERMRKRGDSEEKIQSRLENDAKMFAGYKDLCDVLIPADTVHETALAIHNYIQSLETL